MHPAQLGAQAAANISQHGRAQQRSRTVKPLSGSGAAPAGNSGKHPYPPGPVNPPMQKQAQDIVIQRLRAQYNDVEHDRTMDGIRAGARAGGAQLGHELIGIVKAATLPVVVIAAGAGLTGAGIISVPVATAGGVGLLVYSAGASIHSRLEEARGYHKRTGKHQSSGRVIAAGTSDLFGAGGLYTGSTNRSLLTGEYLGLSQDELAETYGSGIGTGLTWLAAGKVGKIGNQAGVSYAARQGRARIGPGALGMHEAGTDPLVLKVFRTPRIVTIENAAGARATMKLPRRGGGITVEPALFTMDQLQQVLGLTGDEFEMGNVEPHSGRPYMRLSRGGPAKVIVSEDLLNTARRYDPIGHGQFHDTNPSRSDVRTQSARSSRFGDPHRNTQGRTLGYHTIGLPSGATISRTQKSLGLMCISGTGLPAPSLNGAVGHFRNYWSQRFPVGKAIPMFSMK